MTDKELIELCKDPSKVRAIIEERDAALEEIKRLRQQKNSFINASVNNIKGWNREDEW